MDMGIVENMTTTLGLDLNDACELQRLVGQYSRKQITHGQFVAGVEELANKIVQRTHDCLCFELERTERCKVCDQTYPPSEIVIRDGEKLCEQCDDDKYPIKPEDIPF